ncbi:4-hydroxy-2-oxoheptanedioate aldolase [Aureimonas ureilytica]|uniref:4-hydroxy-2-oxoheptanedioate aldolase n=1 Tax=Aureimonas ureilytica TaxID=401562 RepID=UPI000B30275C|nr:4-hydroxy-2-oxoheptanedioate aldolase [Aureimonas ureilytica]
MTALPLPRNAFKAGLREGRSQIGLWSAIPDAFVTEALAGSGFDWILLDTEHSPGDVLTVLPQLQALAPYPVSPVVRPAMNDPVLIKRFLDIGAQTLLIPYVQSAAEARAAVGAMRYPPSGIRGVSALTRATRFGRVADYAKTVESELCLLVQVETGEALDRLEEIAAVEGVDGVFIGPADLAASLGHVGQPGHPEVVAAVEGAIARIRASGKPAGILTPDKSFAKRCIALGTSFTAVGVDLGILARQTEALAAEFQT